MLAMDHSFTSHPHIYPQMEWAILVKYLSVLSTDVQILL